MIRNASHDRDELLVTGIAPAAPPLTRPLPGPVPEALPDEALPDEAPPVFVDATGWRARLGRRLGLLVGALLLVFLGALGLGMTTGADVPLTPWSGPSAKPQVKLSRPSVPAGKTKEPPAAVRPRHTAPSGAPRASAAPGTSAAPAAPAASPGTPAPAATGTATARPGRSQATPPAYGKKRKSG
ncbi:hypothetical protein [Actinomadura sp. K4S16]|uniref:hypothetical protein n=1 Tax=Actinomadura sp. K4S16 TaxID=1316147 RepID=UPI0011ED0593|nr:hypothetical protein [Actinomadura sp. K4S16]